MITEYTVMWFLMGFFNTTFAYRRAPKTMPAPNTDDKNQWHRWKLATRGTSVEQLPVVSSRHIVDNKEEFTKQ
jgi:hypothetical protein